MTLEQAIRILHPASRGNALKNINKANYYSPESLVIVDEQARILACEVMEREVDRPTGCEHCCAGEELGYGSDSLGRSAYLYLDGNILTADLYSDSMAVAIRFCPMCGRKLNDGKVDGDG